MLADGGQDFIEHPAFKSFRRGQLTVNDKPVHIAFRDKQELLYPAIRRGFHFGNPFAVGVYRFAGNRIPQSPCHIRSAEQVLAVLINDPDAAKLRVLKIFIWFISPLLGRCRQKGGRYQPPAYISWLT